MVDKVVGIADNFEVIFEHAGGDCWTTAAPGNVFGEYVLELWAWDKAGNSSYMATMLYLVSRYTLQAYIIPFEFAGLLDTEELIAKLDRIGLEAVLRELRILKGSVKDGTEN